MGAQSRISRSLLFLIWGICVICGSLSAFPFSFWKPATASFTDPTSIAGLKLWLKADSLALSDGTAVSSWTDSSGTGNTATQGTGGNQPVFKTAIINSKPVIRFNGPSGNLSFPNDPGATTTTFVVGKINVAPGSLTAYAPFIIHGSNTAGARISAILGSGTNWGTYQQTGGDMSSGEALVSGTSVLLCITASASSTAIYRSGTLKASNSGRATAAGANGNTIGAEPFSVRYLNCDIAEIVVYGSIRSTTDRQNGENFERVKYA